MTYDPVDKDDWEKLKDNMAVVASFNYKSYSNTFLQRRVQVRLHALKVPTYKQYMEILRSNSLERELLLKELTIHVTNFFRDTSMWTALINEVIPDMIDNKRKKGMNSINIWSAGCSSGEEPISLAICFIEALGKSLKDFKIQIIGTDSDAQTISHAEAGEYFETQFKEIPKQYINKYFTKRFDADDNVVYTINPEVASIIRYEQNDISSKFKLKNMDLILCRNTVIYFDAPTKNKLYEDFYDCLNDDGFLILGKTEILQGPARNKFLLSNTHERIYLKI